jgi:hypothetical protein
MDEKGSPETAWDSQVARYCRAGLEEHAARELVAIEWLQAGDKRALLAFRGGR